MTVEQQKSSDALLKEAVEKYSAKRYEEAADLFKQAYDIQREPEILYNIARCYERMANAEEAVAWYQRFLEEPGTTGELRSKALTNTAALQKEIAAKKAAEQAATPEGEGSSGSAADNRHTFPQSDSGEGVSNVQSEPDTENNQNSTGGKSSEDSKKSIRSMKIAGWTLFGVGVASATVGGVFGGLAVGKKNDYDSAGVSPDKIGYRDDLKRNALIFDVAFPIGAALVVTGISLAVISAVKTSSKKEEATVNRWEQNQYKHLHPMPSFIICEESLFGGFSGRF